MKLSRNVGFWAIAFLCLNAAACFRTLDVSKVKCNSKVTCPEGYICNAESGKTGSCVRPADGGADVAGASGQGGKGGSGGAGVVSRKRAQPVG